MEAFTGKVWVLGDDIDTDIIIPTEYLALKTIDDMKQYGFSPLRPELAGQIEKGDIIVAGKNFGCGSSREHAPVAIKASGISCVIAKSFARIFYRNAINNGMLLIECDTDRIQDGDQLFVDIANRVIRKKNDPDFKMEFALSDKEVKIVNEGGLLNYIEKYHSLDI